MRTLFVSRQLTDGKVQWLQTSLPLTLVMSAHMFDESTQEAIVEPRKFLQLAQTVQLPDKPEVVVQLCWKLFLEAQLCMLSHMAISWI